MKYAKHNFGGVWGMCYLVPDYEVPKKWVQDALDRYNAYTGDINTYFLVPTVFEYRIYHDAHADKDSYEDAVDRVKRGQGWDFDKNSLPGDSPDGSEYRMADFEEYRSPYRKPNYRRLFPVPITYFESEKNELGEVSL